MRQTERGEWGVDRKYGRGGRGEIKCVRECLLVRERARECVNMNLRTFVRKHVHEREREYVRE